jgi:hypothetical protein
MGMNRLPLLVVVEGVNDIAFLKSLGTMLRREDSNLPDLVQLELDHRIIFLPVGGSNLKDWMQRIAGLHKKEFHCYDKEQQPETAERQKVVDAINQRPGCKAVLTSKRALENYLHPQAVREACHEQIAFNDDTDVPTLLAQIMLARSGGPPWPQYSCKGQRRMRERSKRILNYHAVGLMTPQLLAEQDPGGEVIGWLRSIGELLDLVLADNGHAA